MVQYVLIGLALGSIYAIASASLVVTFVSAGVLNFAFGSMAYLKGLMTPAVAGRFAIWKFGAAHAASSDPVLGWGLGGWSTHVPPTASAARRRSHGRAYARAISRAR